LRRLSLMVLCNNYDMESNTLSRRYELPTCLLEISTERSPLSDWQSQPVAQNLHFRLQLMHSQKVIKGNQQQITNLIEVVTAYCDRWLAQDDFETLNHAIAVPKLTKLKLSTLQLFDLYESLELCASEFVILPNLVLEVRRLNPNWLKVIAGAIAIVGVSIGAIRLISPPFGDQPSYQLASTPTTSDSEKVAIYPSSSSKDTSESQSGATASSKPSNQANTTNPSINPYSSAAKPNAAIAPTAPPSQSQQGLNRDSKPTERVDKVAIAPNAPIIENEPRISKSITRQREIDNSPARSGAATESRRLESPNTDALSQPSKVMAELSKPSPSAPSAKSPIPSAASRAANENIGATTNTGNLKVLQIQSELPSDVTTALVRYIQSQSITTTAGTIAFELEISGDRIINISVDSQDSTLKDDKAIAELEKLISNWRSPNPVTGKIRLVLQLSP
jgi:hypothetical protein